MKRLWWWLIGVRYRSPEDGPVEVRSWWFGRWQPVRLVKVMGDLFISDEVMARLSDRAESLADRAESLDLDGTPFDRMAEIAKQLTGAVAEDRVAGAQPQGRCCDDCGRRVPIDTPKTQISDGGRQATFCRSCLRRRESPRGMA